MADRGGLTDSDVAALGQQEALQRLELLSATSRVLDATLEDYGNAVLQVVETCVPAFADLCAVEVIGPDGEVGTPAYGAAGTSGLVVPEDWEPIGRACTRDRRAVLAYPHAQEPAPVKVIRESLGAQSLIVAPITGGGITLGWFVAATGPYRRGFRPSALRVGVEMASRLGSAVQRVMLHKEMQEAAREQNRTVRRLRRLATAAVNLAGAATTRAVLEVACVEACVIQEADGAIARWWMADGSEVSAHAGEIDWHVAEGAFRSVTTRRPARGPGWVAYPLPSSDPWQQAALVVFVRDEFSADEELVLSSLASLIPVAFERAVGTETAIVHEARLRAVVESSPVALIGLRPDGTVTSANRAALDLFGWNAEPAAWSLTGGLRPAMIELADTVRRGGAVVNRTVSVDGRDLSVSGAPMPAISPADANTVLIAGLDLSEIRRAEQALVQAQRLEAMGQVAGRIAHDFNNLLTLILGYADILRRSASGAEQESHIDHIEDAARRAADLTSQMLGMTRREDTGVVLDLGAELARLRPVLAQLVGPKVDLHAVVSTEPVWVRMEPSEVEQILVNLTINACDALDGDGEIVLSLETADSFDAAAGGAPVGADAPQGPCGVLAVSDNGPGMSAEVQARCLEPFFTTKQHGHGTGLGLPTVYGLVHERGGILLVESAPGEGTAMRVVLPLTAAPAPGAAEAEPAAPQDTAADEPWPAEWTVTGRVLLVEDEEELRRIGQDALTSIGLEVVAAASAEAALDVLDAGEAFDALVTDIMLPGLSGPELAATALAARPSLPVLYMTAYSGSPVSGEVPVSPASILRKPYRPDSLRRRVAALLGRPSPGDGAAAPAPAPRS